ncbi:MAG: response regulator transcription factor [Phycisphaerales bacterium]|nr:MAG: response regulator transcription factor [Phycisphaerales bacterium]
MTKGLTRHIFFVDDEPGIRETVRKSLMAPDTEVSCFASAHDCLEQLRSKKCDLLITDVRMPGMDGLELIAHAKRIVPWIAVLVVSGYGDIPMAVKALKAGAADFLEKPLTKQGLLSAIESALAQNPADPVAGKELTKAERRVLHFILAGKSNRETAEILHRSEKTIEVHRNRIMRKLGVDNIVALIKRAAAMGLMDLSSQ